MDTEKVKALVEKYNSGRADDHDMMQLDQLIEQGVINMEDLHTDELHDQLSFIEMPSPSGALDNTFYEMLRREKNKGWLLRSIRQAKERLSWSPVVGRLVAASVLLLLGVGIGRFYFAPSHDNDRVEALSQQINELKEMMMLSLLEKDEATERLKAVNLTHDMDEVSSKVTAALLKTLNNDDNVNVRLAALEALKPYLHDSRIREELVRSIGKQKSPLVQVALAELMAALQEKSSVDALKKILHDSNTPEDVKKKIEESLNVMS